MISPFVTAFMRHRVALSYTKTVIHLIFRKVIRPSYSHEALSQGNIGDVLVDEFGGLQRRQRFIQLAVAGAHYGTA
jgi:hypothetical protein